MMNRTSKIWTGLILIFLFLGLAVTAQAQVEARWIKVGNLHNFYQAHGSEPEEAYGSEQQFGFRWPAWFDHQDMQAAKAIWIGVKDFDDPIANQVYPYKVVHTGPRPVSGSETNEIMPVELKMVARYNAPTVLVDGAVASDLFYDDQVDELDLNLPSDRMIYNECNTSVGISFTRKIYAYTQQYMDNFFIYEYTFTNTGIWNINGDTFGDNRTLEGVYFHWQFRNAIAGEGTVETAAASDWYGRPGWNTPRDMRWGINTMNDVLGTKPDRPNFTNNYESDDRYTSTILDTQTGVDQLIDPNAGVTSDNIMRFYVSWHGYHSELRDLYDNIGSPNYRGYAPDGRLGAWQYMGAVTIHADKSPADPTDDINQPASTPYVESNAQETQPNDQFSATRMQNEYLRLLDVGHPVAGSHAIQVGFANPNEWQNPAGGYSQTMAFGPYTLAPGESVKIVWAEAAGGLGRSPFGREGDIRGEVGRNWYDVVAEGKTKTLTFPDGTTRSVSTKDDANLYKNTWVYTGRDSIVQAFRRAIDLYRNKGLDLGTEYPPAAPSFFEVISQGNRIALNWDASEDEVESWFEGYKVYRAQGDRWDSTYIEIADLNKTDGNLSNEFFDYTAVRGQSYYYFIISYDDGSRNTIEPGVPLYSSPHLTRTNTAAILQKPPAEDMSEIRVVPNPYNISNINYQYAGEPNKIMFVNLPNECKIKIFTERGDLIYEMDHAGSGDRRWDLITSSRQIVVSGVYIATFEDPDGNMTYRKFVVIR